MGRKVTACVVLFAALILVASSIAAVGTELDVDAIDFIWDPAEPEIGELVAFAVTGAPGTIDVAQWNFGEAGCSGYPETAMCTPLYTACTHQAHKFASAGAKTVSVMLTVDGQVYPAVTRAVTVADTGACDVQTELDFTVSPIAPDIGDAMTFRIQGVTGEITSAAWNFGGPACGDSGFTQQTTCVPDGNFVTCIAQPYKYSSAGTKTVTLSVNVGGSTFGPVSHQVTVSSSGSCTGGGGGGTDWSGWDRVATGGAGDSDNTAASCMAAFGGYLFVATENPTTGIEVLRSSDGQVWTPVAAGGFGDGENVEATALVVFDGRLLLTTTNETTGGQVWQSPDGVTWTKASPDGFLNPANTSASAMAEFAGDLYVGTSNQSSGGQVWRTPDASQWSQVNTSGFGSSTNKSVTALAGFNSQLYAGATGFWGFRLFRRASGLSWSQIGVDGFGDNTNTRVTALVDVGGEFFLGTRNELTGGEVWSSTTGSSWSQVNEDGFGAFVNQAVSFLTLYDATLIAGVANPQSGGAVWAYDDLSGWYQASEAGFGDQYNVDLPAAAELNGTLYVGTENPFGFQIWRHVPGLLFADGFELGSGGEWSAVAP